MALFAVFDDLPDLVVIELFSFFSSIDVLWSFTRLNDRLTTLLSERGYFRRINLSSARRSQFDTLLSLLTLENIDSLAIDSDASPLQLTRWPHLRRLKTLRLTGLRYFDDLLTFLLRHATTLTHLTIESNEVHLAESIIVDIFKNNVDDFGYS
jgi:hypothetical protein